MRSFGERCFELVTDWQCAHSSDKLQGKSFGFGGVAEGAVMVTQPLQSTVTCHGDANGMIQ